MRGVVLVDDQEAFRQIIRKKLEQSGDFQVVAEYGDGSEVVGAVEELGSNLILMDVQMPRMNGFEAARRILEHCPDTEIILTSMNADSQYPKMAQEVGVMAFIAKRDLSVEALRAVLGSREG